MIDMILWVMQFIIGAILGWLIYDLVKVIFFGRSVPDEPDIEVEAILQMPKLRLESVDYKDQTVYLLNQLPGKFLGQGMSVDEIRATINKKFAGQKVIIVSDDGTEGTIVTVPNA